MGGLLAFLPATRLLDGRAWLGEVSELLYIYKKFIHTHTQGLSRIQMLTHSLKAAHSFRKPKALMRSYKGKAQWRGIIPTYLPTFFSAIAKSFACLVLISGLNLAPEVPRSEHQALPRSSAFYAVDVSPGFPV